jgi:hypothetical protein
MQFKFPTSMQSNIKWYYIISIFTFHVLKVFVSCSLLSKPKRLLAKNKNRQSIVWHGTATIFAFRFYLSFFESFHRKLTNGYTTHFFKLLFRKKKNSIILNVVMTLFQDWFLNCCKSEFYWMQHAMLWSTAITMINFILIFFKAFEVFFYMISAHHMIAESSK